MSETPENSSQSDLQKFYDLVSSANPVPASYLREAMNSSELKLQSAAFSFIMDPNNTGRVVPSLSLEDYQYFALRYLTRCITENPSDDVAHSRWSACYELGNWFRWLWTNPAAPKSLTIEVKNEMRKLFLSGDLEIRKALIQGTLEHLFENPSVQHFFSDWMAATEFELAAAYKEASEWSQHGGHSSLWK